MTIEPDYPRSRGGAALGARLRRLSDRIDREVAQVYAERNIRFEQRWYGVLNQIVLREPIAVTEIAAALRISHVSVSQATTSLERAGYIVSTPDSHDGRRRLLGLSTAGQTLVEKLRPLWSTLDAVAEQLNSETGNVVGMLDKLDDALASRSLAERVNAEYERSGQS